MSQARIRSLFEARLNTWAATQKYPVAWQNVPFTQPPSTYLAAYIMPAQTLSQDLAGAHRGYRGLFQVNVVIPAGQGAGAGETILAALDALFPVDLQLTMAGFMVQVVSPMSASNAIESGNNFSIPVKCRYWADTI